MEHEMLQDYTMYIWKLDRRLKAGRRAVQTYVYRARHDQWMQEEVRDLQAGLYPKSKGFILEFVPTMRTVRNLMTGELVQIPHDTPRSCDPSTELYWSM
jgi:hypothetical protein